MAMQCLNQVRALVARRVSYGRLTELGNRRAQLLARAASATAVPNANGSTAGVPAAAAGFSPSACPAGAVGDASTTPPPAHDVLRASISSNVSSTGTQERLSPLGFPGGGVATGGGNNSSHSGGKGAKGGVAPRPASGSAAGLVGGAGAVVGARRRASAAAAATALAEAERCGRAMADALRAAERADACLAELARRTAALDELQARRGVD
jgi:hypothetical protein